MRDPPNAAKERIKLAWYVFSQENWQIGLGVTLNFTCYYAFFPGVTLCNKLTFLNKPEDNAWFVIVICTYASIMDTLGRIVARRWNIIPKNYYLVTVIIRDIYFTTAYLLTWFKVDLLFLYSDWFILGNLAIFSYTVGHFATIGMKYGSDHTVSDSGIAGTMMAMTLTAGVFLGSTIAEICFTY